MPLQLDWNAYNLEHITRHALTPDEVEYALEQTTLAVEYQNWHEEDRFTEIGMTQFGRCLLVITTFRGDRLRVLTAYDAPQVLVVEHLKTQG